MKKNTFLVAALLAAVSVNTLADEPQKLTFTGDKAKEDSYSTWNALTKSWGRFIGASTTPIPAVWIDNSIAVFNGKGVNPANLADSIKVDGVITCSGIEVSGDKDYYVTYATSSDDKLVGAGSLIKEGMGDFRMLLINELEGGTIVRGGRVCANVAKNATPNVFGPKITLENGGVALAENEEGSSPIYSIPIEIPEGKTGAIYTGRRTKISAEISGAGNLTICPGGDRVYLAESKDGKQTMKFNNFSGDLTIAPNKGKYSAKPGYYGVLLETNKTFTAEPLNKVGVDSTFYDKKIMLNSEAGLTGCSGTPCFAIGELRAEDATCFLGGYGSGGSDTPHVYYMIGGLNTNVVLPLTIKNVGNKVDRDFNYVGIIKVGTGTYTFTSPNGASASFYGLQVWEGAAYINIPVTESTTALGRTSKTNALTVFQNAVGGGNGKFTGPVVIEGGTLEVGYHGVGELALADTLSGNIGAPLTINNNGKVEFELSTTLKHDKLSTNRAATFNGNKIIVKMAGYYNIKDGDEFTILTSAQKTEGDTYEVEYENLPEGLTLTAREESIDNGADEPAGYKIIIKATGSATGGNPGDEDPQVDPEPNAIEATEAVNEVSVYPNPSDGEFYVEGNDIQSIQVYNNQGQLVAAETAATKIDLSGMAKGIYFAKIKAGNDTVVKKLVIK